MAYHFPKNHDTFYSEFSRPLTSKNGERSLAETESSAATLFKEWKQKIKQAYLGPLSLQHRQELEEFFAQHPHLARNEVERAATQGATELLKILLPFSTTASNSRALGFAAEQGHAECVQILIPVSDVTSNDHFALRWAAHKGHAAVVRLLIPYTNFSEENNVAMKWSLHQNRLNVVELLLPHCDPLANESEVLHFALEYQRWGVAQQLVPISDVTGKNHDALTLATLGGSVDVASLIFQQYPLEEQTVRLQELAKHQRQQEAQPVLSALQILYEQNTLNAVALHKPCSSPKRKMRL